jgi:uncharacterized protein YbjT (DUF2867 family)
VTEALIIGATGDIGGHLAPALMQERTPPALEDVGVAYYLVHSMGGGDGAFAQHGRAGSG